MPIPEPSLSRASTLYTSGPDGKIKPASKEQRLQHAAAVTGAPMPQEFTASEIEIARRIVAQADAQSKNKIQVMDPNNPPKDRYVHQRFPMMVYDHKESKPAYDKVEGLKVGNIVTEQKVHVPAKLVTKLVHDELQLERALARGWSEQAPEFANPDDDEDYAQPETMDVVALESRTRNELLAIAKERGVKAAASLSKDAILALLLEPAEV